MKTSFRIKKYLQHVVFPLHIPPVNPMIRNPRYLRNTVDIDNIINKQLTQFHANNNILRVLNSGDINQVSMKKLKQGFDPKTKTKLYSAFLRPFSLLRR